MAQARSAQSTKHRLVWTLETQVNEAETSSYEVGEQRERGHRYYSLQPLGNEQRGRSHYISPDVLDAVESKKAVFAETFLSSRDVVKFTRCPYPNEAEAKTAYVNQNFKRNHYERLFRDAWHDAFVAKRCVVLAEWFEDTKTQVIQLQGAPAPLLQQQLQQMGAVDADFSEAHVQQMPSVQGSVQVVSGRVSVEMPDGYVKYTLVQPERYFRDPDAAYNDQAQWETIEEDIARGQLIDWGYDEEQIMGLAVDYRFRSEEEDAARKKHDSSWTRRRQHNRVDEQETVTFYRTWTWLIFDEDMFADLELDFEPPEGYALYEIHWSMGEVLQWQGGAHAIKVVEESGIFEWSEMKISHAENGMCTADVVAHTQKTTSTLKRLVIDNQQMANTGRIGALSGGLKNPRDLLDNKIGATLWMKRPDALVPIPHTPLSPFTMEAIAMMKNDADARSGMTDLAKGTNKDVITHQNAKDMIDRATTAGQRRVAMAARDFANTFLIPLAQFTVHKAMEHDQSQDQIEIGGQMVPIAPSQWQDDSLKMDVAVALTPDEAEQTGQMLLMMHGTLTQDPTMALSYGIAQKHALLDMVFDLFGVTDTTKIMLAPSDPQFAQQADQQSQQAQQEQQKNDMLLGAQVGHVNAQTQNLLQDNMRNWAEYEWKRTNEMADNMRADEQLEHDKEIDHDKIQIERTKARSSGGG